MFFSCWYIFDYFCSVLTKNFKYSGNIQLFGDTFTNNLDFFSFISSFSSLRFVSFFSIVFIRHHRNKKKTWRELLPGFCCCCCCFSSRSCSRKHNMDDGENERERENQEIKWVHGIQNTKTTTTKREWKKNRKFLT